MTSAISTPKTLTSRYHYETYADGIILTSGLPTSPWMVGAEQRASLTLADGEYKFEIHQLGKLFGRFPSISP